MENNIIQRSFEDEVPCIVNPNEHHMACLFLLDTSGSMCGGPIEELNAGLNRFREQVSNDETTRKVLDVAIVEFNDESGIVQEFIPVEYMREVNLSAGGCTNMSTAIHTAVAMIEERVRLYKELGAAPYKPWIVMVSDGEPTDDINDAVRLVNEKDEQGKLRFFSLGVGSYDSETLHRLSGPRVMKLRGMDFTDFFDWVGKSMRVISVSSPGEKPAGVPLPANVDKDTSDWQ